MGESVLKEDELEAIGAYVKNHMADWMKEANIIPFSMGKTEGQDQTVSLGERIVRVEEGIKHQGDLLEKMLDQLDKRFEQVDKRLEQMDKRFELVDRRFEQVDKRFEELRSDMNRRFNQMFAYLTTGIVVLGILISVYQFLG